MITDMFQRRPLHDQTGTGKNMAEVLKIFCFLTYERNLPTSTWMMAF